MTANQISYANYKENARHNLAMEGEAARHNLVGEQISWNSLYETIRANQARERLTAESQAETHRANLVREGQNQQSIDETVRANKMREYQNELSLAETNRHNLVTEGLATKNYYLSRQESLARIDQINANIAATQQGITESKARVAQIATSRAYTQAQMDKLAVETDLVSANIDKVKQETENLNPNREVMASQIRLRNAQTDQIYADDLGTYLYAGAHTDQGLPIGGFVGSAAGITWALHELFLDGFNVSKLFK